MSTITCILTQNFERSFLITPKNLDVLDILYECKNIRLGGNGNPDPYPPPSGTCITGDDPEIICGHVTLWDEAVTDD